MEQYFFDGTIWLLRLCLLWCFLRVGRGSSLPSPLLFSIPEKQTILPLEPSAVGVGGWQGADFTITSVLFLGRHRLHQTNGSPVSPLGCRGGWWKPAPAPGSVQRLEIQSQLTTHETHRHRENAEPTCAPSPPPPSVLCTRGGHGIAHKISEAPAISPPLVT